MVNREENTFSTGEQEEAAPAEVEIQATRVEIENTRADIADTLEAIKEKLEPAELMEQAKEKVQETAVHLMDKAKETAKDAVTGAVTGVVDEAKQAVGGVVQAAKDTVGGVMDTAKEAGSTVADTIRNNPIPAAMVLLGGAWLYYKSQEKTRATHYDSDQYNEKGAYYSRNSSARDGIMDQVKEKASQMGEQVKEKASHVGEAVGNAAHTVQEKASKFGTSALEQTRMAGDTLQRTLQESPLPLGVVALGIGAAIGFMVPETEQEKQFMGETRDKVVERAQESARNLATKVQTVAEESLDAAKNAAQQEAKYQGLITEPSV
jgi:hypothetical protein